MLKIHLDMGARIGKIEAHGKGKEILADCLYIVSTIYNELGPVDRIGFRELLTAAVTYPDSPVWEIRTPDGEDGIKAVTFHFPDLSENGE